MKKVKNIIKNNPIQESFEPPTTFQVSVAQKLNIDISKCSEEMAGAKLRDFIAPAILDYHIDEPTERQFEFAEELGISIEEETRRTAKIKIKEHLFIKNQIALNKLGIKKGDSITFLNDGEILETKIISTIKPNGRIYYKGTNFQLDYASKLVEKEIIINAT